MFEYISLEDANKLERAIPLTHAFTSAVRRHLAARKPPTELAPLTPQDRKQFEDQMAHAVRTLDIRPVESELLELKAGAWLAYYEHKVEDLFTRRARRTGMPDAELAKSVPERMATSSNAELFERYGMMDIAAVVRAALRTP